MGSESGMLYVPLHRTNPWGAVVIFQVQLCMASARECALMKGCRGGSAKENNGKEE